MIFHQTELFFSHAKQYERNRPVVGLGVFLSFCKVRNNPDWFLKNIKIQGTDFFVIQTGLYVKWDELQRNLCGMKRTPLWKAVQAEIRKLRSFFGPYPGFLPLVMVRHWFELIAGGVEEHHRYGCGGALLQYMIKKYLRCTWRNIKRWHCM